jgi:hypothetical protein
MSRRRNRPLPGSCNFGEVLSQPDVIPADSTAAVPSEAHPVWLGVLVYCGSDLRDRPAFITNRLLRSAQMPEDSGSNLSHLQALPAVRSRGVPTGPTSTPEQVSRQRGRIRRCAVPPLELVYYGRSMPVRGGVSPGLLGPCTYWPIRVVAHARSGSRVLSLARVLAHARSGSRRRHRPQGTGPEQRALGGPATKQLVKEWANVVSHGR